MGACDFHTIAVGKTANEAFSTAREQAGWDHGHSGYSGTIYEKSDYVLFQVPPRTSIDKLLGWVNQWDYRSGNGAYAKEHLAWTKKLLAEAKPGKVREAKANVTKAEKDVKTFEREEAKFKREVGNHWDLVRRMGEVFDDKWGPAVAVEVTSPTQKKKHLEQWSRWHGKAPRGSRVFIFTGMASS